MEEIWIKHYSSHHKILLVGEGDFSFAACLASTFGDASNMIATCLDSEEELARKHPTAAANLDLLKSKGCLIMHGLDARTMSQHPQLNHMKFDRIVFNFPHAGFIYPEHNSIQIGLHEEVVRGFLKNAYKMVVSDSGEVHVTHKTAHPFSQWDIENIAISEGFKLAQKVGFYISEYPGYENKRGSGLRSNCTFPVGDCSTFKFFRDELF